MTDGNESPGAPVRVGQDVDVRALLDPELAPVLGAFEMPPLTAESLALLRGGAFLASEASEVVERTEHVVPGDPPIPVRVHRPTGTHDALPALFTIHGGGYVLGSYAMDDFLHDEWSPQLKTVGVSVEYRLAPETPYPGPLEDCYAALRWTYDHAEELGIDATRIGLYGLSAGGGLAAALALLARDRGEIPLAFQLLDCPMLDDRQATSSLEVTGLYVWNAEANEFGWRAYLGDLYGTDAVPAYAAAGRATDLTGLPPSCVVVGSIDGFRDEDVDYALRLNQAGVSCELHVIAGLPHAYQMVPDSRAVRMAERCKTDWMERQFRRG